jgi:hypothetical protein
MKTNGESNFIKCDLWRKPFGMVTRWFACIVKEV